MPDPHQAQPEPSVPRSQRELVGLALQRGCRHRGVAPASEAQPPSQRDRVRLALQLGLAPAPNGQSGRARTGIYR